MRHRGLHLTDIPETTTEACLWTIHSLSQHTRVREGTMPRRFKGEIFRQSGVSYLVVGHDREQPDMLLVKTVNPARELKRMHKTAVANCIASDRNPVAHSA